MRQRGERCFPVVIADSGVRPLAQYSVRSERWKCEFVLIELNLYRVIRRDESADEEGRSNSTHARKPQPLVIEPVVDLNDPEFFGGAIENQPLHQRVQYCNESGIVGFPDCNLSLHGTIMLQREAVSTTTDAIRT